jgi:predicted DNA-binding protein YlxM (UPF0122 family)
MSETMDDSDIKKPLKKRKWIPIKQKLEILDLLKDDSLEKKDIAKKFNISVKKLRKINANKMLLRLKTANIEGDSQVNQTRTYTQFSLEQKMQILDLLEAGDLSVIKIAQQFHVHVQTIYAIRRKEDVIRQEAAKIKKLETISMIDPIADAMFSVGLHLTAPKKENAIELNQNIT